MTDICTPAACGNCSHWIPPLPNNECGRCTVAGDFAGTLRPQAEFWCKHFQLTEPRRLVSKETC